MKLLGVEIVLVMVGVGILKDVMNEVLCDWVINVEDIYYLIGMVVGLYLYLEMVCDFQFVIGKELCEQMMEVEGWLLDVFVVVVGGGFNVIGLFYLFFDDKDVKIYGVEVGGCGLIGEKYCVLFNVGKFGVLYGNCIYLFQDDDGQIFEGYLILVGFDYLGIGLEYFWLKDIGCVEYVLIMDNEVFDVFQFLMCVEGIILVLEFVYVFVQVVKLVL